MTVLIHVDSTVIVELYAFAKISLEVIIQGFISRSASTGRIYFTFPGLANLVFLVIEIVI